MAEIKAKLTSVDPVWSRVCEEAVEAVREEPLLGGLIHSGILHHGSMERSLAYRFSLKLASGEMSEQILRETADEAYAASPELAQSARADLVAGRLAAVLYTAAAPLGTGRMGGRGGTVR